MGSKQANKACHDKAKVEISASLLTHLLSSGAVAASDLICLDDNARKTLWQSLLHLSAAQ
ncbi:MAG: hypothetical protein ACPG52_00785 [Cognaticolwellia sp.]